MNKFFAHSIHVYFVAAVLAVVCDAGVLNEPKRYSNDQGLIPFPRVGRGGDNALKYAKLRNELFAFPRIGRSQALQLDMKRNGPNSPKTMNTGLWFGPRLGRVQKRNMYPAYVTDVEDYYNSPANGDATNQLGHFSSHIVHDSDEDLDLGDDS